ncbi:unnamed protein product [Orchesella dallaii]|uniref:Cytochrome b561 domain-containing protein n=1 Tax=Orchesella dallaii TaxID=48710 RepID=A0ABP1RJL5_9HEXA
MQHLSNLQNENVTTSQIEKWWELISAHRSPRVFPLCITKDEKGSYPPELANWGPILNDIEKKNERKYEKTKHFGDFSDSKNKIKKFYHVEQSGESGEHRKFTPLDQWVYLHINMRGGTKGFLAQAITGPLGVPGGQFDNYLVCDEVGPGDQPIQGDYYWSSMAFVHPCSVSPRSNLVWPNIFVVDGTRHNLGSSMDVISFRFRWPEAHCLETGFFQFIFITTDSFSPDDYQIKLSPILKMKSNIDTGISTSPYDRYNGQAGYICSKSYAYKEFEEHLIPNSDYDMCLSKGVGRDEQWTCPPGPFTCGGNLWKQSGDWNSFVDQWLKTSSETGRKDPKECCELGQFPTPQPPSNTTGNSTMSPFTSVEEVELELGHRAEEAEKASRVTHGDLCILTWFVIIPLANYIARHYKEFPDFKKIGLGFWILAHVALHISGLVLIWLSFGLVVGTGENKLGDVSKGHFIFGLLVTLLHLLGFVTALQMLGNLRESEAFNYLATHALGGKAASVFSIVVTVISVTGKGKRLACGGLVLIRIIGVGLMEYVEWKQGKLIGVYFHRARCPALQRILMDGGARPPLMRMKVVLICVMTGSLILGFTCIKIFKL